MSNVLAHVQLINLPVAFLREGEAFIAYTPALDLSTSGKTYEDAKRRFGEIVKIFFEETAKHGTLEDALMELGWNKVDEKWQPPSVVAHETETIKVAVPA